MRLLILSTLLTLSLASPADAIPVRVFIMAGQSNMSGGGGFDDLPTEPMNLKNPQEDVLYHYRIQANGFGEATEWIRLKPLLREVQGTVYASEITFGRRLADRLPNEQIAIIKVSSNGTDLQNDWHPSGQNGSRYQVMLDHVAAALQQLEDDQFEPLVSGFVWVHGNGDTANSQKGAEYEENLNALFAAVRDDWNVSDLPILFNQLHVNSDRSAAGVAAVRQSQANVAASDPLALMINIDDLALAPDSVHFLGLSHQELGYRFADAYLSLRGVPEPSGLVLLVLGVILLGSRRVRRTAG